MTKIIIRFFENGFIRNIYSGLESDLKSGIDLSSNLNISKNVPNLFQILRETEFNEYTKREEICTGWAYNSDGVMFVNKDIGMKATVNKCIITKLQEKTIPQTFILKPSPINTNIVTKW